MLPLKGKTVLITRSAEQAEDFINQLEDLGARTISLPLITNSPINETVLTNSYSSKKYDWLIFTSPNAVKFFFKSIDSKLVDSKIAVVGEKTKRALLNLGLEVAFVPAQFTAKNLAKELPITKGETIFIPRSNLAKDDIVEILRGRACKVEALSIYENKAIDYTSSDINDTFQHKIDYITFTSGSTVKSFYDLGIDPSNEKLICIGPETAKAVRACNFEVGSIANPHTIEGMVDTLIQLSE